MCVSEYLKEIFTDLLKKGIVHLLENTMDMCM